MGPKYLQVAVGQQRSFSLSQTKLSCNAESSITQMFLGFGVSTVMQQQQQQKKGKSLWSFQTFPHKKNDACNLYTLYFKLCVKHHLRTAQPVRTWESSAKEEAANLRQVRSCHWRGLCPAKNVGAFPFVCLSQQHMQVFGRGAQISGGLPSPSEASSWRWGNGHPCVMERHGSHFWNVQQIWQRTKTRSVSKHRDRPDSSLALPSQRVGAKWRGFMRSRPRKWPLRWGLERLTWPKISKIIDQWQRSRDAAPPHIMQVFAALTLSTKPCVDDTLSPGGEGEEQPTVAGTALVKPNGSRCSNQASLTALIGTCTLTGPKTIRALQSSGRCISARLRQKEDRSNSFTLFCTGH